MTRACNTDLAARSTPPGSLRADPYPQEQKLDRDTLGRWRSEAVTAPAQDRLWLNRCEALCNALLDKQAELAVAYGDGRSPEETEWFSALDRAKDENKRLRHALEGLLEWAKRHRGGDKSLDPEEWYIASEFAQVVLKGD